VEVLDLPGNSLVTGTNVLAVEVHQSASTSSDVAFGMSLHAIIPAPPTITDPNQPSNRVVQATRTTTFSVAVAGSPAPTFQWFKNSAPITDATNSTYTILSMQSTDAGSYFVRAAN